MLIRGFLCLLAGWTSVRAAEMKLPLEFEANQGQFAPEVLYLSRTSTHFISLTREGMTLGVGSSAQRGAPLKMKLMDANAAAAVVPENRLPGISNYYIGNDPTHWQRAVPHYGRIRYQAVWPGIDLIFHGRDEALEYDFAVAPGADPAAIRLRYANAGPMSIDAEGNLTIETSSGKVVQRLPAIYQESKGARTSVSGKFEIAGDREVRFQVGAYDPRRTLVIDPTISYSTYIGGTGTATVRKIAVDGSGNLYLAGAVSSPDFPLVHPLQQFSTSVGLFRSANQGTVWGAANPAFGTSKVLGLATDPNNPAIAYAATSKGVLKTVDGGNSWTAMNTGLPNDAVGCIAIDPLTPATLYACTLEGLFKTTDAGATWNRLGNAGAPIAVAVAANTEGTIWLTFQFGYPLVSLDGGKTLFQANSGQIVGTSVAIDPTNSKNVFFGSSSGGLLITNDGGLSFKTITAGLATTGSAVSVNAIAIDPKNPANMLVGTNTGVYRSISSGLGFQATQGLGNRTVLSVLFDSKSSNVALAGTAGGGVFVSTDGGQTWKGTGPSSLDVNALAMSADEKSTWAGLYSGNDAFLTKVNSTGTAIVFSTYMGGSGQTSAYGLAVDSSGHSFVCGSTNAPDFPAQAPVQRFAGGIDMFISRLSASGSLDASTYLGGRADDSCYALALDSSGRVYVAGTTILLTGGNSDFPATSGVFGPHGAGGQDCVVAKLENSLAKVTYAAFLGGNSADACYGVAADPAGNAYVVGSTYSTNFPLTQPPFGGTGAVGSTTSAPTVVAKIAPDGSALIYSRLLGGVKGVTQVDAIVLDITGRAYVTGYTAASDYPVTADALDKAFVAPFSGVLSVVEADGSKLAYSTFLPATFAQTLALDASNNVWLTGSDFTRNLPVTSDALPFTAANTNTVPWLGQVDTVHSKLLHATYLGGSLGGSAGDVAVSLDGAVYVAGQTLSTDFAVTGTPFKQSPTTDYSAYLMRLLFSSTSGGNGPNIAAVLNGASFQNGFNPGAFMTITGANLSTVIDGWDTKVVNGQLPASLDGVSVSVGGKPAYVSFISPTQINAVAPDVPAGPVTVTVTNAQGTSAGFPTLALAEQPGFFLFNGKYAVATHLDFTLAIKNGTFAGLTTVAAKPGDVIILWGTGFGPTNPPLPTGALTPSGTFVSAKPVTVKVGTEDATVYGAALAPGFAALYQVGIQIPATLADGDYPVVATVDGQSSPATTLITVQH